MSFSKNKFALLLQISVTDVSVGFRPPWRSSSRCAPAWRLHTNLYGFGISDISYTRYSSDLNLGEGLCICSSFHFPDAGLYLLNGFEFYFELFWVAWRWKPAIGSLHVLITWPTFGKHENSSLLKNFLHRLKEHIKIRKPEKFQPYISKVAIATAAESWKHLYEINKFCHPVTLAWFSIQILVNSKIFKPSLNLSFTHLRTRIALMK